MMEMKDKVRILVVDDEEDIRLTLEEFLIDNNFTVFLAENALKALAILKKKSVDIVISDLIMPGMNGITLTKEIIESDPKISVIVMTAYASIERAVESMKAGAFDFITKPFNFKHTLFIIEKALETKRLKAMAQKSNYYKKLSNIDELTGIHNRRFFKQLISSEIKRHHRYNRQMSMLMIDIDDFKKINDSHGHLVGDSVLKSIASLLKKSIRGCDLIARYGGEEFAAILPETSEPEAKMVAERIVVTIQNYSFSTLDKKPIGPVTVTVGLASFPKDAKNKSQLLDKSDKALYMGKHSGKNRISIFHENGEFPKAVHSD